jgi:hypothetical protein
MSCHCVPSSVIANDAKQSARFQSAVGAHGGAPSPLPFAFECLVEDGEPHRGEFRGGSAAGSDV